MSARLHVVIPYVRGELLPEAHESVLQQYRQPELIRIDGGSPFVYAGVLQSLWSEPGDLVMVGQSVVLPRDALQRFRECTRPWCGHQVEIGGLLRDDTLGCVRFGAGLKRQLPTLMIDVLTGGGDYSTVPSMREAAGRVIRGLRERGHSVHLHQPPTRSLIRGELLPASQAAN